MPLDVELFPLKSGLVTPGIRRPDACLCSSWKSLCWISEMESGRWRRISKSPASISWKAVFLVIFVNEPFSIWSSAQLLDNSPLAPWPTASNRIEGSQKKGAAPWPPLSGLNLDWMLQAGCAFEILLALFFLSLEPFGLPPKAPFLRLASRRAADMTRPALDAV